MSIENNFIVNLIKHTLPDVDSSIANAIAAHFELTTFNKNDFILKEGKVCNDFIFLERGFTRGFTYDTDGNEVTTNFYGKNSIVFEVASYFKRTASKENIQTLTECTAWVCNYSTFQTLFHSVPEFREFGRANLVNGFIALKERTMGIINLTAEERYENLLNTKPEIFQHSPLKYIASYLGITDTSLSRIRKEITQK